MTELDLSSSRQKDTQKRIEAQQAVIASLRPGSAEHRLSVKVLLLLQDALHLLVETEALLADARRTAGDR